MPSELEHLLSDELSDRHPLITVEEATQIFTNLIDTTDRLKRSKTPAPAASLNQFYSYVDAAIGNQQDLAGTPTANRVRFTEEEPDFPSETETITFSLIKRMPGQFHGGPPFSAGPANLKPMFREQGTDLQSPGVRKIVTGYWYDNLVRFTCWARTNKGANARAEWLEDMMEKYSWWFKLQGVDRVLFWERQHDIVTKVDGNKWYGRPLDYFVRTEKIRVFEEETLKEILIKLQVTTE